MSYTEADQILHDTFVREKEHKQKLLDKRRRRGEVVPGEQLTRAEMDARMWAFLYAALPVLCPSTDTSVQIIQALGVRYGGRRR